MVRFEGERGEVSLFSGEVTPHLVQRPVLSLSDRVRPRGELPEVRDDRPDQQIVEPRVAGSVRLEASELERKLGKLASTVWRVLRKYRDSSGITHITHTGLMRKLPGYRQLGLRKNTPFPISEDQIDRAFRRLKAAGLLEHHGWKAKRVPRMDWVVWEKVYTRCVRGNLVSHARSGKALKEPYFVVPEHTAAWIEKANTRGGAREGAGRPVDQAKAFARARALFEERWGAMAQQVDWGVAEALVGPRPTTEHVLGFILSELQGAELFDAENLQWVTKKLLRAQIQTAAGSIQTAATLQVKQDSNRCPDKSIYSIYDSERVDPLSSSKEEKNPASDAGVLQLPAAPEKDAGFQGARSSTPLFARSPIPRPWIDTARIPPPPLLDADDPPDTLARKVAKAYTGALDKVFHARHWGFKGYDPSKWKGYSQLVAGARLLAEYQIAPATWVLWCFKSWKNYVAKTAQSRKVKEYPPPRWVFAQTRIEERKGWFRREESEFIYNRVINGPKVKELIATWYAYQADLYTPGSDPNACVRKHFPGDTYERMVEGAKAEAAEYRQRLAKHAEEGVFLW